MLFKVYQSQDHYLQVIDKVYQSTHSDISLFILSDCKQQLALTVVSFLTFQGSRNGARTQPNSKLILIQWRILVLTNKFEFDIIVVEKATGINHFVINVWHGIVVSHSGGPRFDCNPDQNAYLCSYIVFLSQDCVNTNLRRFRVMHPF